MPEPIDKQITGNALISKCTVLLLTCCQSNVRHLALIYNGVFKSKYTKRKKIEFKHLS